jgi:hypothetical protein
MLSNSREIQMRSDHLSLSEAPDESIGPISENERSPQQAAGYLVYPCFSLK